MIVVGGESLIDLIVYPGGRLAAISGGGPFNTARTIGRLGVRRRTWAGCRLTGSVGRCSIGSCSMALIAGSLRTTDEPTTLAVAELDDAGAATYRFYVEGTAAPGLSDDDVAGRPALGARALHIGTLGLVLEPMGTTLESFDRGARDVARDGRSQLSAVGHAGSGGAPSARPAARPPR